LDKKALRKLFQSIRKEIVSDRRNEAISLAYFNFKTMISSHKYILSYSSFQDEFCTKKINELIANNSQLVLPKVEGEQLKIYTVNNSNQLKINPWGIYEPDPSKCIEVSLDMISLVLVPGLAFDKNNHRIGYGKGFYDRFLCKLSKKTLCYGLGFKEQYSEKIIPVELTDIPLSKVLLF